MISTLVSEDPLGLIRDRDEVLDRVPQGVELGAEYHPWLLPRIVTREIDGVREFYGLCRAHRWLSALPAYCPHDVPHCPRCSDRGFAAFDQAERQGLL